MTMHVRNAGAWVEVGPGEFKTRFGGVWQVVQTGYVRDGGSWKPFYQNSDPLKVLYDATDSASFRQTNKWRPESDGVFHGSWNYGDHIGAMAFDWGAIQAQLATRPTVVSVRLRLRRRTGSGYGSAKQPYIWLLDDGEVNASDQLVKSGEPSITDQYLSATGYEPGERAWSDLPTAFGDALKSGGGSRGLATCNGLPLQGTSLGGGGQDSDYMIFNTSADSDPPRLEIISDF